MKVKLPPIIDQYVAASNRHDVQFIIACFSDEAVVCDEGESLRGKMAIENWVATTIAKYKFQFKPLGVTEGHPEIIVAIEVAGTFPGSPVTLDYHFTIADGKILSLAIS